MRVLIVDDHPLYIRGIESLLLELDPDIETQGAGSVEQALAAATAQSFDLVLLDLKLPGMHGLDALTRAKEALHATPIVVVSGNDDTHEIWRAIEMGAAGYIPKDTDPAVVTQALRLVLARGIYIPPHVVKERADLQDAAKSKHASPPELSSRQLAVLQLLLQGKSNKAIARDLGIAEGTIKAHLSSIYQSLGVNSRLQAMTKAHETGIVDSFASITMRPGADAQ